MATTAERGHRVLPGTAGCIVEAWAPSKPECLAQAVRALVEAFADTSSVVTTETLTLVLPPAPGDEQLSELLEQVLELRALLQVVPVDIALAETEDGGLAGCVDVAALAVVQPTGAAPRGITGAQLELDPHDGLWTARAVLAP